MEKTEVITVKDVKNNLQKKKLTNTNPKEKNKGPFGLNIPGGNYTFALALTIYLSFIAVDMETVSTPIYSVSLNDNLEGFGIFFGSVDTVEYYYYYIDGDEGLILEKTRATNTEIIETDFKSPKIIRSTCNDLFCKQGTYKKPKLIVPVGTLKLEYNIEQEEI